MDPSHVSILLFQVTVRKKLFQVSMVSGYLWKYTQTFKLLLLPISKYHGKNVL